MREYKPGDKVVIAATVRYSNPSKGLAVLQFADGSETAPMHWELLDALEGDARANLYVPEPAIQITKLPSEEFAQLVDSPQQAD